MAASYPIARAVSSFPSHRHRRADSMRPSIDFPAAALRGSSLDSTTESPLRPHLSQRYGCSTLHRQAVRIGTVPSIATRDSLGIFTRQRQDRFGHSRAPPRSSSAGMRRENAAIRRLSTERGIELDSHCRSTSKTDFRELAKGWRSRGQAIGNFRQRGFSLCDRDTRNRSSAAAAASAL